jgi:hypothetical protein
MTTVSTSVGEEEKQFGWNEKHGCPRDSFCIVQDLMMDGNLQLVYQKTQLMLVTANRICAVRH